MTHPADGRWSRTAQMALFSRVMFYPDAADPVDAASDAAVDWAQGALATIIAGGTLTRNYIVSHVKVCSNVSGGTLRVGPYQLDIYSGADLIGTYAFDLVDEGGVNVSINKTTELYLGNDGFGFDPADDLAVRLRYGLVTLTGQATVAVKLAVREIPDLETA